MTNQNRAKAPARIPLHEAFGRAFLAVAAVFAAAKLALVVLRLTDGGGAWLRSPWALPLLFSEDAVAALGCGLLAAAVGKFLPRAGARMLIVAYAALTGFVAINVPVARVLSTPLTYQLLGGTGGAMADSILSYVTVANVIAMLLVIGAAAVSLVVGRRARLARTPITAVVLVVAALGLVTAGRIARRRIDPAGLHGNALITLLVSSLAVRRSGGGATDRDRTADAAVAEGPARDLSFLRGAARGRNIIVVALESTGARYLGLHGASPDAMPNLSRLARSGVVFEYAYAAYPESIKGLWAVLCGAAPAPNTEAVDYAADRLPCAGLPASFAAAHYRTGLFHSGRFLYLGMEHIVRGRRFDVLCDAGCVGGVHESSFGTDDLATAKRVLTFIDETPRDRNFLAFYLPIAGHHPYSSPGPPLTGPFPVADEIDRYRNDLWRGDRALGALIDGVEHRGLGDRTLWLLYGDHGEAFRQHEANVGHSIFLYEENVRVPFVIAAPGLLAGVRAPQIASVIDIAPTLLELAGLPVSATIEGQSLLDGRPRVARFFTDWAETRLGLREDRWKLLHDPVAGRTRLYDLTLDPDERTDTAAAQPERAARYVTALTAWSAARRAWVKAGGQLANPTTPGHAQDAGPGKH